MSRLKRILQITKNVLGIGLILGMIATPVLMARTVYADPDKESTGEESGDDGTTDYKPDSKCATILSAFCPEDGNNGEGLRGLVKFVINLMAGGVVVLGAIGIVVCSVMWMSARDNENQVKLAKKRLIDIVIGMVLFVMIDIVINMLLGGANWR